MTEPKQVTSDVPKGIQTAKSPERIAFEKKLKTFHGSPEHLRMLIQMKRDYEKNGVKFEQSLLKGENKP
jgi:hypothetical protein